VLNIAPRVWIPLAWFFLIFDLMTVWGPSILGTLLTNLPARHGGVFRHVTCYLQVSGPTPNAWTFLAQINLNFDEDITE
jgi:hypothetical protein